MTDSVSSQLRRYVADTASFVDSVAVPRVDDWIGGIGTSVEMINDSSSVLLEKRAFVERPDTSINISVSSVVSTTLLVLTIAVVARLRFLGGAGGLIVTPVESLTSPGASGTGNDTEDLTIVFVLSRLHSSGI
jgi:hypothetical protein